MSASVYLISQEKLVITVDISVYQVFTWASLQIKEAHEVGLLAMNVPKDFDGAVYF